MNQGYVGSRVFTVVSGSGVGKDYTVTFFGRPAKGVYEFDIVYRGDNRCVGSGSFPESNAELVYCDVDKRHPALARSAVRLVRKSFSDLQKQSSRELPRSGAEGGR